MGLISKLAAVVRGTATKDYATDSEESQLAGNNRGDLSVALGLPPLTELVRLGGSYQVAAGGVQAALTTEPTTTAGLTIYNGGADDGVSYAIDSVAVWERVVDATQQNQLALFAMLNNRNDAAPSGGTALTSATAVKSLSGRQGYSGAAVVRRGGTVADNGWFPVGDSVAGAATVAGGAWRVHDVSLKGLFLVPPKCAFSVQAAKVAATASQLNFVIRWHEVQLDYLS